THTRTLSLHDALPILVSTGKSKEVLNDKLGGSYPLFKDFKTALEATDPNAVCISTYPDTHEAYAIEALNHGCHVFIEKPLADTRSEEHTSELQSRENL